MYAKRYVLINAVCILFASCSNSPSKPVGNATPSLKKPPLTAPFRYHKAVEVAPGQTYDIFSWGRGSTAVGAFAILHSDSAGMKYTTTTGDLDGSITDVYNSDMDTDGNPEILIQSQGKDTINYTKIYAFEFRDNDANKLDFPRLTSTQKKGYRGNDNFYIRDGKLIREFPIYDGNTSAAKLTGAKRQLEYGLRSNSFTVTQLSKDSTSTSSQPVVKQQEHKQKQQVSSKKKRRQAETRKKRRRRRG